MHDHLEPVEGFFSASHHAYHARVRETLLADFSSEPLAGLVVLPSFEPEHALWIGKDWRRYYAVYRIGRSSIWQALQNPLAPAVTFSTHNAELPAGLAKALEALFWAALGQTRYYNQRGIRLDGTAYYATAWQQGRGSRTGQTWSPASLSKLGDLVALAESLIQQLINPVDNPSRWAELTESAVGLRAKFSPA
ncbi:MAG: hypothetical protein ACRYFX_30635 [Janthinobacterium lividum]